MKNLVNTPCGRAFIGDERFVQRVLKLHTAKCDTCKDAEVIQIDGITNGYLQTTDGLNSTKALSNCKNSGFRKMVKDTQKNALLWNDDMKDL